MDKMRLPIVASYGLSRQHAFGDPFVSSSTVISDRNHGLEPYNRRLSNPSFLILVLYRTCGQHNDG